MGIRVAQTPREEPRTRCYVCYRPADRCFCSSMVCVQNRTEVIILQDRRERFHPFNTARIARQSFAKSTIISDRLDVLQSLSFEHLTNPGLLYPAKDAMELGVDSPTPAELILLDGTWFHAKQMIRKVPALKRLPRYRLAPKNPGQYRIRREPNATTLSTIEAAVLALQVIEPDTLGLDQVLGAFHEMVEQQLAHPKAEYGWRKNRRRSGTPLNIPLAMIRKPENCVIAYGESIGRERQFPKGHRQRLPIFWTAQRMITGETFSCAIHWPQQSIPKETFAHLQLGPEVFEQAVAPEDFLSRWHSFLRPDDYLAVYNQSTLDLLRRFGRPIPDWIVMKCVQLSSERRNGSLADLIAARQICVGPPKLPGRAGIRLAAAAALAQHLNEVGNGVIPVDQSLPVNK